LRCAWAGLTQAPSLEIQLDLEAKYHA